MADYKGLTIVFGADTRKLSQALRDAKKEARGTQTELNAINKGLKYDPTNVNLLARKQEILTQKIKATNNELEVYRKLEEQADSANDGSKLTGEQWARLQTDIFTTTQKLKEYEDELKKIQVQPPPPAPHRCCRMAHGDKALPAPHLSCRMAS